MPPNLIEAFASTLEDSIESDILLHVIDSSDPKIEEKIEVVDNILTEIKANQKKIYVFNKIDLIEEEKLNYFKEKFDYLNPLFISSFKEIGIDILKEKNRKGIIQYLKFCKVSKNMLKLQGNLYFKY